MRSVSVFAALPATVLPLFGRKVEKNQRCCDMTKKTSLLQKMGIARPKTDEDDEVSAFEKRLKMVNRARVVNKVGLGGPVFKIPASDSEV